jgi:hypothetical protein
MSWSLHASSTALLFILAAMIATVQKVVQRISS